MSPYNKAIDVGLNHDIAMKYSNYLDRKTLQKRTGRVSPYSDSTKSKVYSAEWDFRRRNPEGEQSMTIKEAEKYFYRIVKSKTYQSMVKTNQGKRPTVRWSKDMGSRTRWAGRAYTSCGMVVLSPSSGNNKYTILHELAHMCGNPHHDISFRQDLVRLVSRFMGTECGKDLKRCFRNKKLKMTLKTNVMEPLEWYKSYQKMERIRNGNI